MDEAQPPFNVVDNFKISSPDADLALLNDVCGGDDESLQIPDEIPFWKSGR